MTCVTYFCYRGVALLLPQGDLNQLAAALARAPADALRPGEPLYHCPACGRVYWRGTHYKRMRAKLTALQSTKRATSAPPVTAV